MLRSLFRGPLSNVTGWQTSGARQLSTRTAAAAATAAAGAADAAPAPAAEHEVPPQEPSAVKQPAAVELPLVRI